VTWTDWRAQLLAMAGVAVAITTLWHFAERLLRPHRDDEFFAAMKRHPERIKKWMEGPDMFGAEITERRAVHARAEANTAAVTAIHEMLERQRPMIERFPPTMTEIGGQIAHLARAIKDMADQMNEQRQEVARQGKDLAHMAGQFDAQYGGPERRGSRGRRATDPNESER
jgi:uncharacterized coiled-coil protein SlyX